MEITVFFPDIRECNDFIRCMEDNESPYIIIGKETWKSSVVFKKALYVYWMQDESFVYERLLNLIEHIICLFPADAVFRLIGFHEKSIELLGKLQHASIFLGLSKQASILFRDKFNMINQAKHAGILVPRTRLLNEIDGFFDEFVSSDGYIIKPRASSGSYGVEFFKTKDECYEKYHILYLNSSEYIIQEYIYGYIYQIDGVTINNKLLYFCCIKHLTSHMEVGKKHGAFMKAFMLAPDNSLSHLLYQAHEKIRLSFGLDFGCTHMEFFVKSDNSIIFCEGAARPPSAGFLELHKLYFGKSAIEALATLRTNASLDVAVKRDCLPGVIIFTTEAPVTYVDDIHTYAYDWVIKRSQNTNYDNLQGGNYHQEIGRMYIVGNSEQECESRLNVLAENFKYKVI